MKPKVAFFSFTSCEGCQLTVLECEDLLLDILSQVDIVRFREASSFKGENYEIAFIEGSITREEEVVKVRKIRNQAKIIVALGACATQGGINFMKNFHFLQECKEKVYGDKAGWYDTTQVHPVDRIIPVDYYIYGCPITKSEFLDVLKSLLIGKQPRQFKHAVCVECRAKENICLFDRGKVCLGSVARAGCDAACPSLGSACEACRGVAADANLDSLTEIARERGLTTGDFVQKLRFFNGNIEVK